MSFAGMATAVSGLRAAQAGLAVTGHNMSNSEIKGYARQRIIQKDFYYTSAGTAANGNPLVRGLGTDWNAISQIRNEFLDFSYRQANSKLAFYTVKTTAGVEIESLLGELQGSYNFQSVIQDMWFAIEELTSHPQGVETRDNFLATAQSFVTKSDQVYDSLLEYQYNLDQQVRGAVNDVNDTVGKINKLNTTIAINEASGDNANDYRDERNRLLDRLSELIPINYSYDLQGNAVIFSEGHSVLVNNKQNFMGLRYTSDNYSFVEPVFTGVKQDEIIRSDVPPTQFEPFMNYNKPVNADRNNDYGVLKGLVVARGAMPAYYPGEDGLVKPTQPNRASYTYQAGAGGIGAGGIYPTAADANLAYAQDIDKYNADNYNYNMHKWSIENGMIPKTMMKLDEIFHSVVTLINDTLAPARAVTATDGIAGTRTVGSETDNTTSPPTTRYYLTYAADPSNPKKKYYQIKDENAPYDNNKEQNYIEVFSRSGGPNILTPRFDENGNLIPEEDGSYYTQYSIGNTVINPALLTDEGGFNLLAFSFSGDIENTQLLNQLQVMWQSNDPATNPYAIEVDGIYFNVGDSYQKFVAQISTEIAEANSFVNSQEVQVDQADAKRQSVMGVSMDEEMNFMMKYQYAYQAAARIVNVIDSMIDKVVNGTGRAGL